ncbi:MAG: transposase, partial [Desulfonatronovibrio sp.]
SPTLFVGGFLKGGRHRICTPAKREQATFFGCLNLKTQKFYWKKSNKGNSDQFICFLRQLLQNNPEKKLIIIVDNASIHKSKKVKEFLNCYDCRFWGLKCSFFWIKPGQAGQVFKAYLGLVLDKGYQRGSLEAQHSQSRGIPVVSINHPNPGLSKVILSIYKIQLGAMPILNFIS